MLSGRMPRSGRSRLAALGLGVLAAVAIGACGEQGIQLAAAPVTVTLAPPQPATATPIPTPEGAKPPAPDTAAG